MGTCDAMAVRAVFFDLDDTLGDEKSGYLAGLEATCRHAQSRGMVAQWRALYEAYHAVSDDLWLRFDDWGKGLGTEGTRRYVWTKVLQAAEVAVTAEQLEELVTHYCREREARYRWLEGAEAVYRQMCQRYVVGIVTNGSGPTQRRKLEQLGLTECPILCLGDEVGCSKPGAAIFQRALGLAGVSAGEAVMVGDRAETDMAGALAVGMRAVWVNAEGQPWRWEGRPTAEIRHVRELPAVLADW